jgi:hypothetical protein
MAKSKVVVHPRGRYTEPGGSEDEYPALTSTLAWDGDGTMPDVDTIGAGNIEYESYAYYVVTSINVSSEGYQAAAHTSSPSTQRELLHEVTVVLERVTNTNITNGSYV